MLLVLTLTRVRFHVSVLQAASASTQQAYFAVLCALFALMGLRE
jgi:hypothetical protein